MTVQGILKGVLCGRWMNKVETRNVFYYGSTINNYNDYQTNDFLAVEDGLSAIASNITPITVTTMNYYRSDIYMWDGAHWTLVYQAPMINPGVSLSDALAPQVAVLVKMTTDSFRMKGHKYFGGICKEAMLLGLLTDSAIDVMVAVGAQIMDDRAHGGRIWYPGIPGKTSAFAPFKETVLYDILSTMRRRKIGVGM